jgi:hypothetical protein
MLSSEEEGADAIVEEAMFGKQMALTPPPSSAHSIRPAGYFVCSKFVQSVKPGFRNIY